MADGLQIDMEQPTVEDAGNEPSTFWSYSNEKTGESFDFNNPDELKSWADAHYSRTSDYTRKSQERERQYNERMSELDKRQKELDELNNKYSERNKFLQEYDGAFDRVKQEITKSRETSSDPKYSELEKKIAQMEKTQRMKEEATRRSESLSKIYADLGAKHGVDPKEAESYYNQFYEKIPVDGYPAAVRELVIKQMLQEKQSQNTEKKLPPKSLGSSSKIKTVDDDMETQDLNELAEMAKRSLAG